jgi:hypothetical protein
MRSAFLVEIAGKDSVLPSPRPANRLHVPLVIQQFRFLFQDRLPLPVRVIGVSQQQAREEPSNSPVGIAKGDSSSPRNGEG